MPSQGRGHRFESRRVRSTGSGQRKPTKRLRTTEWAPTRIVSTCSFLHEDIAKIGEALDHVVRSEWKPLHVSPRAHPSKNKGRLQTRFQSGDNVRIHPVADHDRIGRPNSQAFQRASHHERVRLANEIGVTAGGLFYQCCNGTAGRMEATLGRPSGIRICGEEPGTLATSSAPKAICS